jgi:hypothetical protein
METNNSKPELEVIRVITVRMPKSLHERTRVAVDEFNARVRDPGARLSMNLFCIEAIIDKITAQDAKLKAADKGESPAPNGNPPKDAIGVPFFQPQVNR